MFFIPYGTKEDTPRRSFPHVTALIVAINVVVFAIEASILATHGTAGLNDFIMRYAAIPANITHGSPFEIGLITALFIHGGLLHIVGNMLYLLPFGDNVEDRLGHLRYLLFYLICGLVATIVFTLFNPSSNTPLIGASGAIAGVLAGYLRLYPHGRVKGFLFIIILLIPITLPAVFFIGYWFILQLFGSVASLGADAITSGQSVAFLAHIGGFAAGWILAPRMALKLREPVSAVPELSRRQ
jgi:membrane associated rhomboid family serine protease